MFDRRRSVASCVQQVKQPGEFVWMTLCQRDLTYGSTYSIFVPAGVQALAACPLGPAVSRRLVSWRSHLGTPGVEVGRTPGSQGSTYQPGTRPG